MHSNSRFTVLLVALLLSSCCCLSADNETLDPRPFTNALARVAASHDSFKSAKQAFDALFKSAGASSLEDELPPDLIPEEILADWNDYEIQREKLEQLHKLADALNAARNSFIADSTEFEGIWADSLIEEKSLELGLPGSSDYQSELEQGFTDSNRTQDEIQNAIDLVKNKIDSEAEVQSADLAQLQMLSDRQAQFVDLLMNLQTRMHNAAMAFVLEI
jgi:hypothetical protein